ncbi:MAG: gliding motility-associated C-terminal domain-containing protein [Flavobacteriales bacterium]|nr:gliding motility-associated C-terminal domain-containing protein [Flavobacteriales bacterium]
MKRPLSYLVALIFLTLLGLEALASHNRAGEITYRWLFGTTYEFTVVTYTKDNSPADRCSLEVYWGDGDRDTLLRVNGTQNNCGSGIGDGEFIGNNIRKNVYIGTHTYPGPKAYRITMLDPNRNEKVTNMDDSFNTPFFIFLTMYIGTNTSGLNTNSSPVLLNPPIDDACTGRLYVHNAGAYDVDGDSISYKLTDCFEGQDLNDLTAPLQVVLGYWTPANITINPVTGDLIWDTPPVITPVNDKAIDPSNRGFDEYNICFEIEEWRNGFKIGGIQRDMQITVWPCDNLPPIITAADTCVLAGETILIDVDAIDPDSSNAIDNVTLTASGGPLILTNSPATFTVDPFPPLHSAHGELIWQTNCSHVRNQPYSVTFKAEDNHPGPSPEVSLVDFETIGITVIGPAPDNVQSSPSGNNIDLSWNASICPEVIEYKIYRRNGPYTGTIDCPCETGVPASAGYTLLTKVAGLNTTTYTDDDNGAGLIHGEDYCYRIVAVFPDGAESCASLETCSKLTLDVPIITHVSVGVTDANTGIDTVVWSMPKILDDSIQHPPPFYYEIYRSSTFDFSSGSSLIATTASSSTLLLTDTLYIDNGINTETDPHAYQISLYSGSGYAGSTHIASSIYLSILPSDNRLDLSWQVNVPWTNSIYFIYRLNDVTLNFDLLDSTSLTTYADTGLTNGQDYCYRIKSVGAYSVSGIINPIINYSQEKCESPVDKTPPCAPVLAVAADCDAVENTLNWNNPNESCADDVLRYKIYYTPILGDDMEFLQYVSPATETSLILNNLTSLAGCYAISAVDSVGNESIWSDSICVDNCPTYSLPNVFSPDGNFVNDNFIPYPFKFIDKIDLKIYDRWGQLIFETTDPEINWDGKYFKNNQDVSEGVFFYVVRVDMIRLTGLESTTLTGFIHLLRTNSGTTN